MGLGHTYASVVISTPISQSQVLNTHHTCSEHIFPRLMFANTPERVVYPLYRWETQGSERKTYLLKGPLQQISCGARVQVQVDTSTPALGPKAMLHKQESVSM